MTCSEFQELMHRRLDGEETGDASALDQHLAACPACRELHAAAQRLERGLRLMSRPLPPSDLAQRIVSQVVAERKERTRRRQQLLTVAALALAASLLLAIFIGFPRPQDVAVSPPPKNSPIATAPPVAPTPEAVPADLSVEKSLEDAGSALASLMSRTADETVGQSRLLLPEPVAMPTPAVGVDVRSPSSEFPTQSLQEAGQGVSSGLEPLTTSAFRAVNLFLRDAPTMEREKW